MILHFVQNMLTKKSHESQVKAMKYALANPGGSRSINWDWPLFPARVYIFGQTGEILTPEEIEAIRTGKPSGSEFFAEKHDKRNLQVLLFWAIITSFIMVAILIYGVDKFYGWWV
jgi:hypothetical protein